MLSALLLALGGGGLGGVLRFIPEIIKFFSDRSDKDHEYRMSQLQLQIDQARATQQIDLVHAQGDLAQQTGELNAYVEALKGQTQLSGVKWADSLSVALRPVLTLWWMVLFTVYKVLTIIALCLHYTSENLDIATFAGRLWTPEDAGILSMMLGFWFVGRVFDSSHKR